MSTKYKFRNTDGCHFVTYAVVGWVDVFARNVYNDILYCYYWQSLLEQKMKYIHENLVRAGFVEKGEDWVYSSAGDYYCESKGLIELSYV